MYFSFSNSQGKDNGEDQKGDIWMSGIHLEKDTCVPSGHTVAKTMCLFEI